jgi:hypothetical protein
METKKRPNAMNTEVQPLGTRVVERNIVAGTSAYCTGCDQPVKFRAKDKAKEAIANVYLDGMWDHLEHWHSECYAAAEEPYGEAPFGLPERITKHIAKNLATTALVEPTK